MYKVDIKKVFADKTNIFLLLLNFLFLIYYVLLSYYSRPHYDDLHFLWKLKEMSIVDYVSDMYYSRSGRFMGYFINGVVFKTILLVGDHRFFPILFWIFGVGMSWIFVKAILKEKPFLLVFNTVVLSFNLFVLTNIDFPVFYWLCAMSYYLLAPMLLVMLLYVNKYKLTYIQWMLLSLLLVILGGGQEAFTPIVLVALFFNGMYYLHQYNYKLSSAITDVRIQKIIGSAIVLMVCLMIVVVAPGNYKRMKGPDFITPNDITGYVTGITNAIGMFFYYLVFYIPYYFVLALLFIKVGSQNVSSVVLEKYGYTQLLVGSFLLYGLYLILSVLPSVYLFSGFGIQRNYTHVVFFTLFFICFQAFLFGFFKLNDKLPGYFNFSLYIGLMIMVMVMVGNIYSDTISVQSYARSVDKRIESLQKINRTGTKTDVAVDPLTVPFTTDTKFQFLKLLGKKNNIRPVLYYISDTDYKPNEYSAHMAKVYNLNFQIKLKKNNAQTHNYYNKL